MPHIIIKMFPGRKEEQKEELADKITQDVMTAFGLEEKSISISFEEIPRERWRKEVYEPDIINSKENLYKKPGYQMFGDNFC